MIAERTLTSLRNLTHSRTYRDRSAPSRRSFNDFFVSQTGNGVATLDWDVLTQHADDEEIDLEEEIPPNDGIHRLNPSEPAYHPFTDTTSSNATVRRSFPVQTSDTGADEDSPIHPLGYPTRRSPPAHFSLARHSSLSRQSSIRRHPRSRTSDFNEFTTRRRTTGRHDSASQSAPSSTSRASTTGTGESSSSMDIANLLHNHHSVGSEATNPMPVATFGPSSASNALTRRGVTRVRSSDEPDGSSGESSSSSRLGPVTLHTSAVSDAAPSSSRLHISAPRLRRGGVRAPEQYAAATPAVGDGYMHTVRISSPPIPGLHSLSHREDEQRLPLVRRSVSGELESMYHMVTHGRFGPRSPRSGSPSVGWGSNWTAGGGSTGASSSGSGTRQQNGTPTNLPTPRSISPEGSSARE